MPGKFRDLLAPKESIPASVHLSASVLTVGVAFAAWAALTYGDLVNPDFLPSPTKVVAAAVFMVRDGSLWIHIRASTFVIFTGYLLSTVLAVPLGIFAGSFKVVEALVEPLTGFFRYLPVSAMIPLLILWVGIDWESRVAVIFLGTFFQQVVLIADVSANVSKDLLDVSYTLGARRRHVVWRVLIPATLPGVMDNLRITMGWAWTYLVVAELLAASKGLGYAIMTYMRGLFVDRILVALVTIGILGLITDQIFKVLHRTLLPWSPRV